MTPAAPPVDSVLLIGFGGPETPGDVLPFLRRVAQGRGIPEERLKEVAHHYDLVGGRSPYNDLTRRQAAALQAWLASSGRSWPVHVGLRNWAPYLPDALEEMGRSGLRHAAGVILAAHRSEVSLDRYVADVEAAGDSLRRSGRTPPLISYVEPWPDAPGFLEACAARLEEACGQSRRSWPASLPVVFTAHSIPIAMAERSPYVDDLIASCSGVAARLGLSEAGWRLAYQSRSGPPATPWLQPDVLEVLRELAAGGATQVAVQAIGFLSDHVEVLYDLDVEARGAAGALGLSMRRAACVDSHPAFIGALGERVLRLAASP